MVHKAVDNVLERLNRLISIKRAISLFAVVTAGQLRAARALLGWDAGGLQGGDSGLQRRRPRARAALQRLDCPKTEICALGQIPLRPSLSLPATPGPAAPGSG